MDHPSRRTSEQIPRSPRLPPRDPTRYRRENSPFPGVSSGGNRSDSGDSSMGEGIMVTIHNLAHEQERVQKKTFTNWINSNLTLYDPSLRVNDLFEDIKDGYKLLCLLEVLSGETLPKEKGTKLRRIHHISNIQTALQFLESRRIKLVSINPPDVVDGKPAVVLGLIWTIILYFQIEEFLPLPGSSLSSSTESLLSPDASKPKKPKQGAQSKVSVKQKMLKWVDRIASK